MEEVRREIYNFQTETQKIGAALKNRPDIEKCENLSTELGNLTRVGPKREIPPKGQDWLNKKNVFQGEIQGRKTIIIHFSEESYGEDKDYFRRMYETAKKVFSRELINTGDKKIFPSLLGYDDSSMTLLLEHGGEGLDKYFSSENGKLLEEIIEKFIEAIKHLWRVSEAREDGYPRYVENFLKPEYDFLKDTKIEDLLKDKDLVSLYRKTQNDLEVFLEKMNQYPFKRGMGLQDVHPKNVVLSEDGTVLLIDVEKVDFQYHWLSLLGHFYQGASRDCKNPYFLDVLRKKIIAILNDEKNPELAKNIFLLGRLNDLLIAATLRNIVYSAQNGYLKEEDLEPVLKEAQRLLKTETLESALL